jgi:hypothetical protein
MLRSPMAASLPTRITPDVSPWDLSPRRVRRALDQHLDQGGRLRPAGSAKSRPRMLLAQYPPRYAVSLFDVRFHLSELREDGNFRFFVAYVQVGEAKDVHPRLFYKDQSLVWRCATHYIANRGTLWVGKGDMKVIGGMEYSAEETTNLPLELQAALDECSRRAKRVVFDEAALGRVLRRAPVGRFEAYADFLGPRRRAAARRANRVNGGRPVAWFTRPGDPGSLRFAPGFAPDFSQVVDVARSASRMYGGAIRKLRILSKNRCIQYQFVASPRLAWIIPAQTLTTELSTYGVRTLDVLGELYSQIPAGFAGAASEIDPTRYDAKPWLDRLPVIREFRRKIPDPLSC